MILIIYSVNKDKCIDMIVYYYKGNIKSCKIDCKCLF